MPVVQLPAIRCLLPVTRKDGGIRMARFITQSTLAAAFLVAISERLIAQHSHEHSDTAAAACARIAQAADAMNGMDADWKMAAMAKHMAYTSSRPLTAADSVRAAYVVNELRQAIAKYRDVKVAEADGYKHVRAADQESAAIPFHEGMERDPQSVGLRSGATHFASI